MRTETDALLSLQRYVAAALPGMTEVLTELEREAPPRPFAVVSSDDSLGTSGLLSTPWPLLPVTVYAYIRGTTRKDAREQTEAVREALWVAFNVGIGDGRPNRVPLFDYTGRPAVQLVEVRAARGGTWTLALNGVDTVPLEVRAQPLHVREAVEALPGVGVGNVIVFGKAGGPWHVRFDGQLRGEPIATMTANASQLVPAGADPASVSVAVESIGAPEPWRTRRDFANVEGLQLGGLPDPSDPKLRTVTAGLRLTWARGGRVPSAEMTLTGTTLRGEVV